MDNLVGKQGRLPDGTMVTIEEVEDSIAITRRVEGEWKGRIAIIALAKLDFDRAHQSTLPSDLTG